MIDSFEKQTNKRTKNANFQKKQTSKDIAQLSPLESYWASYNLYAITR